MTGNDTMVTAISLTSPSGRMPKRALRAAQESLRRDLFGDGLQVSMPAQPTEAESLRRNAKQLRELAGRGMKPRAYLKQAAQMEARAAELEK